MGSALWLLKSVGSTTTTVVTVPGKAKDGTAPVAISHDLAVIPPILLIITPIRTVLDGDKSQGVLTHDRAHPHTRIGDGRVGRRLAVAVLLADADDAEENVLIGGSRGGGGGVCRG